MTTTSPALISRRVTAAIASSSRSKTRAGPRWVVRSWPAIFTTQPSGARLPFRMTRPPVGLSGRAGDRVLERGAGGDLARAKAAPEHVHHERARLAADLVLGRVGGGDARRAHGREPQELERHRHRVGGELPAARARARADHVLQLLQGLVAHLPRRIGAHRLEEVLDGDVAPAEAAGLDGAAV